MCGITLLKHNNLNQKEIEHRVSTALNQLRHRGPDEHSLTSLDGITLGHTRLSIIDLAGSHQPLADPSERYTLTYNGEIYNYHELKKQLSPHWEFKTSGDTEVILAGLILQGKKFIRKLEGMWAFALWDNHEQSLLLSRDRIGKKPLYFSHSDKTFACASEIPALITLLDKAPTEDLDSTADYFRYSFYLPGHTAYSEIKEVLPGHNATIDATGQFQQEQYWQLTPQRHNRNRATAVEDIRNQLHDSVKKRLVSDVEVGAFLSGGIDSSIIVHHLHELSPSQIKTFTLGFLSKSFDESDYAREISEHYGTDHYSETLATWDEGLLSDIIHNQVGQPFADPSILPTSMVSKLAAKHVKVALSGDGGDELFCGYERYKARAIMRWYTRLPNALKNNIEKVVRHIPEPHTHHSRSLIKKAHLFVNIVNRIDSETPYIAPRIHSDQTLSSLLPSIHRSGHTPDNLPQESQLPDIEEMMYSDALIYLPQDIMLKVDRASMGHSLETRAPFLDHKLVETAFNIPLSAHRDIRSGKRLLHKAYKNRTPKGIWQRRKQGFSVPISEWFRSSMGEQLEEFLYTTESPVCHEYALELLQQHRTGYSDHGFKLWQLYVYYLWKSKLKV